MSRGRLRRRNSNFPQSCTALVTYAVVPLVRPRAIGSASGIVSACSSRGFSFQVGKTVERKRVFLSATVRSGLRVLGSAVAFSWGGSS